MPGFAPAAILAASDQIVVGVPGAVFAGVVAPATSTPGYHWPRNALSAGHYSVQHARDRTGDPAASSALDITLSAALMQTVTRRFRDALTGTRDPRLSGLAEIVGTLDGRNVWSWHVASGFQENVYDSSHLWHIHIGGHRDVALDHAAWSGIAAVFIGSRIPPQPPEDELTPEDRTWIAAQFANERRWTEAKFDGTIARVAAMHGDFPSRAWMNANYVGTVNRVKEILAVVAPRSRAQAITDQDPPPNFPEPPEPGDNREDTPT